MIGGKKSQENVTLCPGGTRSTVINLFFGAVIFPFGTAPRSPFFPRSDSAFLYEFRLVPEVNAPTAANCRCPAMDSAPGPQTSEVCDINAKPV